MRRLLCRVWRHKYFFLPAAPGWLCLRCGRTDGRFAPDERAAARALDYGVFG